MVRAGLGLTSLRRVLAVLVVLLAAVTLSACGGLKVGNAKAVQPLKQSTIEKMASIGSSPKKGTLIRIFKESSELEVWKETTSGGYRLLTTYHICAWSGDLGPKIVEGDRQSPEGFYTITPGLLNPNSNYYLAFNTGFPNKFDRAWGRTGSDLMVHGDCSSRGCYSMTDESIAEIYAIVRETFAGGIPSVQLQIFPFRMTPHNLAVHAKSKHMAFWQNIKDGYDRFELSRKPPVWDVCEKKYVFDVAREGAQVLDAAGSCPGPSGADVLYASVQQKQAADRAAMDKEVAALNDKAAKDQAAADKAAAEAAAAKARGEAIGDFVGGLFGGQPANAADKTVDPTLVAPVPAAPIKRS